MGGAQALTTAANNVVGLSIYVALLTCIVLEDTVMKNIDSSKCVLSVNLHAVINACTSLSYGESH